MTSSHALFIRKLLRVLLVAVIGAVAAGLALLNLIAFDTKSRYFAAAELLLALAMFGALVHEIRAGGWRSSNR